MEMPGRRREVASSWSSTTFRTSLLLPSSLLSYCKLPERGSYSGISILSVQHHVQHIEGD